MLWTHLKISLRDIVRHRLFSFINIAGFTLSLAICLAALSIIQNQYRFDRFHPAPGSTYRVVTEAAAGNRPVTRWASTPRPLAERLESEFGFIENVVPIRRSTHAEATASDRTLSVRGSYTTPSFFDVFGFDLQAGDERTALEDPNSVILTSETAERFFGDDDPLGRVIRVTGIGDLTVTGVLDLSAYRTHLQFEMLVSMNTPGEAGDPGDVTPADESWEEFRGSYTYFRTSPDTPTERVRAALEATANQVRRQYGLDESFKAYDFDVQKLGDISPGEILRNDISAGVARSRKELAMIAMIALVILAMACFNYTNLFIARSVRRTREIGVYKVFGAGRMQIMRQFIVQATIVTGISLILAYAILPFIPLSRAFETEVRSVPTDAVLFALLAAFTLVTGFVAGALPAWLLSGLSPITALRDAGNLELIEGFSLRKSLVVVQFAVALVLTITTLTVYRQSDFVASTDYGFRRDGLMHIPLRGTDPELFIDELEETPGVELVSAISDRPGLFATGLLELRRPGSDSAFKGSYYSIDRNTIENLELPLAAGSDLPAGITGERETHVLLNETYAARLGWEDPVDAVGQTVVLNDSIDVEVAGVIGPVHFESLSLPIGPIVLRFLPDEWRYVSIRYSGDDPDELAARVRTVWNRIAPTRTFTYSLTDEYLYEAHAHAEDVTALAFYAMFLLVIASLGLLGMVTYTVEVRTREVGIRKVLGASIPGVVGLLSREFVMLVAAAGAVGLPAGYWLSLQFLSNYPYRVGIGVGTLAAAVAILAVLGLTAIGAQTWRVARANPVEALRAE
jgi:putative ABC transport system permease protein